MSESTKDADHPLASEFRFFATISRDESPLYAELSARVAESSFLLDLAARATPGQPPPNLLFAAVHDQLLAGADHRLRNFYRSLGGSESIENAFPSFLDFCRDRAGVLGELIASRRVQTNEVGRSALLLPAMTRASQLLGERPLHLVELGASAGLHLNLDLYRFEYEMPPASSARGIDCEDNLTLLRSAASDPPVSTIHVCGDLESPVRLRTRVMEAKGPAPEWLPRSIPEIAGRTGVDIAVVDLDDAGALRWNEALIWPDQLERMERFRQAVRLARARSWVRMIEGDGRALIPEVVAKTPGGVVPCIFHSHVVYQWTKEERAEFLDEISEWGRQRDLCHISLEWLGDDSGPKLHLTTFIEGKRSHEHLADCHHHGRWIQWEGGQPPDRTR